MAYSSPNKRTGHITYYGHVTYCFLLKQYRGVAIENCRAVKQIVASTVDKREGVYTKGLKRKFAIGGIVRNTALYGDTQSCTTMVEISKLRLKF